MKKYFKIFCSVVIAMLGMNSCGDSTGDLIGLNVVPPSANSKILKKVNIQQSGSTAYDVNYIYASGKLVSVSSSNSSLGYILDYDGTTLSKITSTSIQAGQTKVITFNLSYSASEVTQINGNITIAGQVSSIFKTDFVYANGKLIQAKTQSFIPGTTTWMGTSTSDIQYAGNNVSKLILTKEAPSVGTSIITKDFSNYDNYANPYRILPMPFTLAKINMEIESDAINGLSSNNYKTVTTLANSVSQIENYALLYDLSGYPTQWTSQNVTQKFEYIILQ